MAQIREEEKNHADPVARAAALKELLVRNAAQAERDRRIPEENIRALAEANLFRVLVPRRWGGYGVPVATALRVSAEIAKSCPSTAWVQMLLNVSTWLATLLPDRGQQDIFAGPTDGRVCGVLTPTSTAARVKGGYRVNGRWGFASGCWHASWAVLGVPLEDEAGKVVDQAVVYAPMTELKIEDTWFVAGMRGTGSNTLIAKEIFIPDHRVLSMSRSIACEYPVRSNANEPCDRYAFVPLLALVLLGPLLGMAQGVLEAVTAGARKRGITYTIYEHQSDSSVVHHQIGEAALQIDSAWLHAMRAATDIHETAIAGRIMDYITRARVRGDCGYATKLIRQAIDQLVSIAGAASFAEASTVQRFWRDANVAARHAVITTSPNLELYGRALLGVEGNITELI
ncbi:MAG TPA: acyl-CoA dehydrogenase family protein [Candidatus Binataceae bacterium]|nr:acyl-CoA dehydrogenase family protein [Candidatus Binataceae bacterium]